MLSYLNEMLGLSAEERCWDAAKKLPHYLRSGRTYSILSIEHTDLLLIRIEADRFHFAAFLKQQKILHEYWAGEVVLCFERLTSYQRKSLIENHVSFVVPGSQVYLPCLGILLQERTAAARKEIVRFTPASQFLLLYFLYHRNSAPLTKVQLSKQLEISPMSVTRSVQELSQIGLVHEERAGRSDYISSVCTGRELYERARPYLIDPVQKRIYAARTNNLLTLPLCGESALCERTMLNMPPVPSRAIGRKAFAGQMEAKLQRVDPAWSAESDYMELQVWKYDPIPYAEAGTVDVVSLAASFGTHQDERIEMSVDEMLEGYHW